MGTELIKVSADRLPLCPRYVGDPADSLHTLATRILNAFHDAAPKDEDGDFLSVAFDTAYEAALAAFGDRMQLYRTVVMPMVMDVRAPQTVIESWYFRCPVCGFTLPAGRDPS